MINLRLAEYDLETGKFKRFLELGKDFGYYGNFILVSNDLSQNFAEENTPVSESEQDGSCGSIPSSVVRVLKDKKDPLNRFNGLYDGFTYGNGRFVLMESDLT